MNDESTVRAILSGVIAVIAGFALVILVEFAWFGIAAPRLDLSPFWLDVGSVVVHGLAGLLGAITTVSIGRHRPLLCLGFLMLPLLADTVAVAFFSANRSLTDVLAGFALLASALAGGAMASRRLPAKTSRVTVESGDSSRTINQGGSS